MKVYVVNIQASSPNYQNQTEELNEYESKTTFKYDKKTLTAKAGKVTITMSNPSVLPHNVAIKGNGIKPVLGKVVLKGGTSPSAPCSRRGRTASTARCRATKPAACGER